jgi:hypothetical protein
MFVGCDGGCSLLGPGVCRYHSSERRQGRITGFNGGSHDHRRRGTEKEFTFYADEIESIVFDRTDAIPRPADNMASNVRVNDEPVDKKPAVIIDDAPANLNQRRTSPSPQFLLGRRSNRSF